MRSLRAPLGILLVALAPLPVGSAPSYAGERPLAHLDRSRERIALEDRGVSVRSLKGRELFRLETRDIDTGALEFRTTDDFRLLASLPFEPGAIPDVPVWSGDEVVIFVDRDLVLVDAASYRTAATLEDVSWRRWPDSRNAALTACGPAGFVQFRRRRPAEKQGEIPERFTEYREAAEAGWLERLMVGELDVTGRSLVWHGAVETTLTPRGEEIRRCIESLDYSVDQDLGWSRDRTVRYRLEIDQGFFASVSIVGTRVADGATARIATLSRSLYSK